MIYALLLGGNAATLSPWSRAGQIVWRELPESNSDKKTRKL